MIFSKFQNSSQLFNTTGAMISKISTIGLVTCLLITGCSKADQSSKATDITAEEQASQQAVSNNDAIANNNADEKVEPSTSTDKKPEGKPVSYDVHNWKATKAHSMTLENLDALKAEFGNVTVTDKKSLDYASNLAVKYRFMKGDQPYLDIIDSKDYLELGWYFANPNDSDSEKKISVDHAKKVFKVMTGLMGNEGKDLVQNILTGKIIKNQVIDGKKVELAKCEFYSCMIIMNKNG
ncbi:hypothetical protein [Psychrobacter sp.]|uniref:hypothetical protein n=1 Tax=Psychrobacter sp. TaxID=56811 RepID=UPI0025D3990B|nr:hypothetical protein [Psychrobacter sp.]